MEMTTEETLKLLQSAKTEAEMIKLAKKLGVTRAFFNVNSVIDIGRKSPPQADAPKTVKNPRRRFGTGRKVKSVGAKIERLKVSKSPPRVEV